MLKKQLLLFVFLCSLHSFHAQNEKAEKEQSIQYTQKDIRIDTGKVVRKTFDTKALQEYKDSGDFDYEVVEEEDSIFQIILNWIKEIIKDFLRLFLDDIAPVTGFLGTLLKILPWLILAIIIFLLIKYFVKIDVKPLIKKENEHAVGFQNDEDLIKNQNLSVLLEKAKSEQNYRLAVRFYYLLVLRELSKSGRINWQQEKTNEDYIKELKEFKNQDDFIKITRLYDFIWYGNFDIYKDNFLESEKIFQSLISQSLG